MKKRYGAFLRGVMPTNCRMPDLKRAFERAGFDDVRTVLGSGNVTFEADERDERDLVSAAEAAMTKVLGRSFLPFVRSIEGLHVLLRGDPYAKFDVPDAAKRFVTFLREPPRKGRGGLTLPIEKDRARILSVRGREVYSACLPGTSGTRFMTLVEKTFGKEQTTRTWDTVRKVAG